MRVLLSLLVLAIPAFAQADVIPHSQTADVAGRTIPALTGLDVNMGPGMSTVAPVDPPLSWWISFSTRAFL